MNAAVQVAPAEVVTIPLAVAVTGLTEPAIRNHISKGRWIEGFQYHRRDGIVFVDLPNYHRWVRGERPPR